MIASTGTVGRLVAAIQSQLASRIETTRPKKRSDHSRKPVLPRENDTAGIEALITRRVKAIAPDDPRRGRKAFQIFLESILIANFGEQLINDPAFYQLVDRIQTSMESDAELRQLIDAAISHLLTEKR